MSTLPTSEEMSWLFFVAGLRLGDRDLAQLRRKNARDFEARNVAAELIQALHRPRADHSGEAGGGRSRNGLRGANPVPRNGNSPSGDSKTGLISLGRP